MPDVTVQGVTLSCAARQTPRIIVPIMADSAETALRAARDLARPRWDGVAELVELRLDPLLAAGGTPAQAAAVLAAAREALAGAQNGAGRPLLATVRTKREGGLADLAPAAYVDAVLCLLEQRPALADIEFSAGQAEVERLRRAAVDAGAVPVFSEHHFDGTPPIERMTARLCAMADAGAGVAKLAVMAGRRTDAAALLHATAAAAAARPDTPRLTMAMGPLGTVTRVCGGLFGSCAAFGSVGKESAPGQPGARALRRALKQLAALDPPPVGS